MTAGILLQCFKNGDYGSEEYYRFCSLLKVDFLGQIRNEWCKMLYNIKEDPKCHRIVPEIWALSKDISQRGNSKRKDRLKMDYARALVFVFCPNKKI
jgi:hypothetical protein